MAVAFVRSHTPTSEKVLDTSTALAISTATTPGNVLVAYILTDNAATVGKPAVSSIAVAAGETNTWTLLGAASHPSSTTIGAFAKGMVYAIRTTVVWPVASYAVTLDTSVTMKATLALEFSGALPTLRSTVGTNYSTTTTAASATTTGTAPVIGDLAVGLLFTSNSASSFLGDTDTLGGAWAGLGFGSTGGSGATNNWAEVHYKALTATSHQTLNSPATLTAGNGSIVAVLQQYVDPALTQAAYRFYADGTETGVSLVSGYNDAPTGFSALRSGNKGAGQSFLGNGLPLSRVGFQLAKSGTPDGSLSVAIYAHSGTFGTTGLPTGAALTTSTTQVDPTTLGAASAAVYFDFDGAFVLQNGVPYFAVVTNLTATTTTGNTANVYYDPTSPTAPGNYAYLTGSAWAADSTRDYWYEVYGVSGAPLAAQDTTPTVDTSAGDVNAQLRVRLQSTTAVAVDATDDFQLQWEKNASGTWWPLGIGGAPEQLASSYDVTPNTNVGTSGVQNNMLEGQTFMGSGGILSRCEWKMIRTGSPTGTIVSKLYPHTLGTFGTDGEPGDAQPILATSTTIKNHANIQTVDTWESFAFDPVYVLQSGTPYTLAWHPDTTYGVAGTHTVRASCVSGGTAPGNRVNSTTTGASWTPYSTYDTLYRVYELPPGAPAMPYASPNLTDNAATTTRLTGGSGTFTAGKVSEDGLADDVGWAGNNYTEILYSLTFKAADLADGDTIRFRILRNGTTTGLTYTQVPTVTATKGALAPVAGFTSSVTSVMQGNTVTFTDTSTNTPTTWAWNFGTGASPATAATQGPHVVTYSTVGTSTVTLTAGNAAGSDAVDTPTSITVTGWPKTETLIDAFDTAIDSKWTATGTTVWSAGAVRMTTSNSVSSTLVTPYAYDLTGSSILVRGPTEYPAGMGKSALKIENAAGNGARWEYGQYVPDEWSTRAYTTDGTTTQRYSGGTDRWLRIREAAGTIYFDSSVDGVTWVQRGSGAAPAAGVNNVRVALTYTLGTGETGTYVTFDNVNVAGVAGQALTYAKTDNLGLTDSITSVATFNRNYADLASALLDSKTTAATFARNYADLASALLDSKTTTSTFARDYSDLASALLDNQTLTAAFVRDYPDLITQFSDSVSTVGGTVVGGKFQARVGGVWVDKPVKVRIGGVWVTKPLKVHDDGVWRPA